MFEDVQAFRIKWHLVFEHSTGRTFTAKVPGGWLYRHETDGDGPITTLAMCFVPDPEDVLEEIEVLDS